MIASAGSRGQTFARWGVSAEAVAFAVVAALQLTLALAHTPGRDELQAWLIAGASHNLPKLITNMQNEGHPPLWHAMLMFVHWATGSASPWALSGTNLAIAVTTSALIIFRAPFSLPLRVMVILNYFILFEYGTIARAYSIGMLATVCYVSAPRHRFAWLLIAILPHISLHFALLGASLGLWHLLTIERSIKGPLYAAASASLALWFMWPHPTTVVTGLATDSPGRFLTTIVNLGSLVLPMSISGGWNFFGADRIWIPFNLAGTAIVFAMMWPLFRHRSATFVIVCGLLTALLFLSFYVFICYSRHFGVLVLFALVVTWHHWNDIGFAKCPFVAMSVWLAACGLIVGGTSIAVPYTNYRTAVTWIESNGLAAQPWAAYPPHMQIEPSAWLKKPIYDIQKACYADFPHWTFKNLPATTEPGFEKLLDAAVAAHGGTLHIALEGEPLRIRDGQTVILLAEFPAAAFSSPFRFYRINSKTENTQRIVPVACQR